MDKKALKSLTADLILFMSFNHIISMKESLKVILLIQINKVQQHGSTVNSPC